MGRGKGKKAYHMRRINDFACPMQLARGAILTRPVAKRDANVVPETEILKQA